MNRRDILFALAAIAAAPGAAAASLPQIDAEGAKRVGEAYLKRHPGLDARRLQVELLPGGWSPAVTAKLRARAAADFRAGRLFVHRGWRLSDTEGRLFALVALTA
jgi:hypothetical protein